MCKVDVVFNVRPSRKHSEMTCARLDTTLEGVCVHDSVLVEAPFSCRLLSQLRNPHFISTIVSEEGISKISDS